MISEIRRANVEYSLFSGVKGVLVAFSGGADSCALLHSLKALSTELGFKVFALHINHNIRGVEADNDEALCRRLCEEWDIPLTVKRYDVPAIASSTKKGLEEAGRDIRYSALETERSEKGCDVIATAHHANDNLETMLFNLQRGTSLTGICGIPPKRDKIIRPLILATKKQILDYCRKENIEFAVDSTNADDTYKRNYIRLNVIPAMEKLNPDIAKSASETAILLRRDKAILDGFSFEGIKSRSVLASLPDALLSRYIIALCPEDCSPEKTHINSAIKLMRQNGEKSLDFPNEYRFVCTCDAVKIVKKNEITENSPTAYDFTIEKGIIELPNNTLVGVGVFPSETNLPDKTARIYNLSIYQGINFGKIKGNIHIRTRREGDTYLLGGVHRTVKKLMQSLGKGSAQRALLPFFCDDDGIIWIPGFPVRDGLSGTDAGFSYYIRKEASK